MSAERWATHVKNWHALQRDSKKCSEMAAKVHEDTKRMANVLVLPPSEEKDAPMAIPDTEIEHAAPAFIEGKMTDDRGGLIVDDFSPNPTKLEVKVLPAPSVTFSDTVYEATLVLTPAEEQHAMELHDQDLPSRKRQRTTSGEGEVKEIPLSLTDSKPISLAETLLEAKPLVPPLKRLTKAQLEELGYIFVEKDSMDEKE